MRRATQLIVFLLGSLLTTQPSQAQTSTSNELLVFAAASLTNVLDELGATYEQTHAQRIKFSFAASSTLAKQIEAGANADIYIAADNDWADYLQTRQLLDPASRVALLSNQLVLIAPSDSTLRIDLNARDLGHTLSRALSSSRFSIGDPDSVPAGKYARAALQSLKAWESVANKLVLGDSVRTTLNFVAQGSAPLGVVYKTDALIDKRVKILATFADNTHAPIVYPAALTRVARSGAQTFLDWLCSPTAQAVFEKYGFVVLN